MATVLLALVVVLVIAALVFGVVTLLSGDDPGLSPVEPDGRALPLPNNRSLTETDLKTVRFDVELRGYRMAQVDRVLRRTAYDVGYKDEMIAVLEAEVAALREGRAEDAELLRKARETAASTASSPPAGAIGAGGLVVGSVAPGSHRIENDSDNESDQNQSGRYEVTPDLRQADERDDDHLDGERLDGERLDQEVEPGLTEDPPRDPTGDSESPEEKATRG